MWLPGTQICVLEHNIISGLPNIFNDVFSFTVLATLDESPNLLLITHYLDHSTVRPIIWDSLDLLGLDFRFTSVSSVSWNQSFGWFSSDFLKFRSKNLTWLLTDDLLADDHNVYALSYWISYMKYAGIMQHMKIGKTEDASLWSHTEQEEIIINSVSSCSLNESAVMMPVHDMMYDMRMMSLSTLLFDKSTLFFDKSKIRMCTAVVGH